MPKKATTRPGPAGSARKSKPNDSAGRSPTAKSDGPKSDGPMAAPGTALAADAETGESERDDSTATAEHVGDDETGARDPDDAEMVADIASRISTRRILGLEDPKDESDSGDGIGNSPAAAAAAALEAEDAAREPASVPMLLRRGRERYGEDLRTVATALRVNRAYLDALENGDFKRLPGRVYAIGWVRSYAEYLGLDREHVVRQFKDEYRQAGSQQKLNFPITSTEAKAPGAAIIVLSGLLLVVAYGAYYLLSPDDRTVDTGVVEAPERQAPDSVDTGAQNPVAFTRQPGEATETAATQPAPEPAPKPEPAPTPEPEPVAQPEPVQSAPRAEAEPAIATEIQLPPPQPAPAPTLGPPPEPIVSVTVGGPTAEPEYETASAGSALDVPPGQDTAIALLASEPEREPSVYGAANVDARIVIVATEDSWIQVNDTNDGRVLLSRVLREGDSYRIANRSGLELITGNAGGLEVRVDGQSAPALGPRGIVRRDVKLDPTLLLNAVAHPLQSGARQSAPESVTLGSPSEIDAQP